MMKRRIGKSATHALSLSHLSLEFVDLRGAEVPLEAIRGLRGHGKQEEFAGP